MPRHFPRDLEEATQIILQRLYTGIPIPTQPKSGNKKTKRNAEIIAAYRAGQSVPALAKIFGISQQRVHQILQGKHR